jgi:hypothetical protein
MFWRREDMELFFPETRFLKDEFLLFRMFVIV